MWRSASIAWIKGISFEAYSHALREKPIWSLSLLVLVGGAVEIERAWGNS